MANSSGQVPPDKYLDVIAEAIETWHDLKLDQLVGEHPQCPSPSSLGNGAATSSHKSRFPYAVEFT